VSIAAHELRTPPQSHPRLRGDAAGRRPGAIDGAAA
jgi:hypothetical protein